MELLGTSSHRAPVRLLTHIKILDDCFGQFLVRVIRDHGVCRETQPEALVRLVGWSMTLRELALPLSVAVVLVVVPPVLVPLPVSVFIMTPIPIGIAHPSS
jgi:hypothetical protein